MDLKTSNIVSSDFVRFLKCCYRFVNEEWPHANRQAIPDKGFEEEFRAACVFKLQDWRISQVREMHFAEDILTASGTSHEIDIVALHDLGSGIVELKHWESSTPTKNEVIVFFAKAFDYIAANPRLMLKDLCPIFVSVSGFEESGLAACLGLGIHPVGPGLRPVPILVDTAQRMEAEIHSGAPAEGALSSQLAEFWVALRSLCTGLETTWVGSRCGYLSENTIVVRAATCLDSISLSRLLREANGECSRLLSEFRAAKTQQTL